MVVMQTRQWQINKPQSIIFDLIKMLLMLEVVLGHAAALNFQKLSEISTQGFIGYLIIFIKMLASNGREAAFQFVFISGFFSAQGLFSSKPDTTFVNRVNKRLSRLYPVIVIALLLTIMLDYIGMNYVYADIYYFNNLNLNVVNHNGVVMFLGNLLSLQPTFCATFGSNGPIWTIGYLVQFYVITCIILQLNISNIIFNYMLCLFFALLIGVIFKFEFCLLYLLWLLGLYFRTQYHRITLNIPAWIAFFIIMIVLFLSKLGGYYVSVLFSPILAGILLVLSKKSISIKFFLAHDFRKNSNFYFVLYLIHMPVLFFTLACLQSITANIEFNDDYTMQIIRFIISTSVALFAAAVVNMLLQLNADAN